MAETTFTAKDASGTTKTFLGVANGSGHIAPGAAFYDSSGAVLIGRKAASASLPVALSTEDLAALSATLGLTDAQLRASAVPVSGTFYPATQPVSGTFWQATQPISASALPLPSGAATSAQIGEVQASPTANTLLDRLKALLTGIVLAAGENHVGEVGGNSTRITPSITVSTTAYAAGDSIGGKITLTGALRAAGKGVVLTDIVILDRAAQSPTGTIILFNADPTAATITDNAAFVFSTDDLKVIAAIPVAAADYVTINSKAVASIAPPPRTLTAASGTALYAAFVTTSTPTFAASTNLQVSFGLLRD